MTLAETLRVVFIPPHPAGRPFILGGALVLGAGLFVSPWLAALGAVFTLFCLYFFRDPERFAPARPGAVVSPADGRVVVVDVAVPPAELGLGAVPMPRVAIFLSVLNVHVNRMPVCGTVTKIAYHAGKFLSAGHDKASDVNERNCLALRLADGRTMAVVQIAGLIARRILCSAQEGQVFATGARFGIIRFGSRTDLYLPPGVVPLVSVGQTMIGGETVIATLT
jgi:phosphatidylserine decarboxylase